MCAIVGEAGQADWRCTASSNRALHGIIAARVGEQAVHRIIAAPGGARPPSERRVALDATGPRSLQSRGVQLRAPRKALRHHRNAWV
jgi:hypothetical protein